MRNCLRPLALFDVLGMSLFVPLYIWELQARFPDSWMIFPVWLAASFLAHGDTPKTLGWRADNLRAATRQAAVIFAAFSVVLLGLGWALGTMHGLAPGALSLRRLWLYLAFCLLQQVGLQSFLNNRLIALTTRRWLSALLAGAIFAAFHWPNPVLVPVTFVGGTAMAGLFSRHRNILPLAVGQALIGSLVWACFPVDWHRGMRVGPGFFRP